METCKHQNTTQFCSLCTAELSVQPSSAPETSATGGAGIDRTWRIPTHDGPGYGTGTFSAGPAAPDSLGALTGIIRELQPLKADERARVLAATSAWFEGEDQ